MSVQRKHKRIKFDNSDTDDSGSEHELSYYMKDRVKLMKEVLKLLKPKKIKSMAPDCIKKLEIVEINSLLLEELLGISKKRLGYIFNGENVDRDTSSSESEDEKLKNDVISLDDVSDDDVVQVGKETEKNKVPDKVITSKRKRIKRESDKNKTKRRKEKNSEVPMDAAEREKLMSVLEILELQARARAIKSQLALEESQKKTTDTTVIKDEDSDPEAVIVQSPKAEEIVITSDESETESKAGDDNNENAQAHTSSPNVDDDLTKKKEQLQKKVQRIRLIRQKAAKGLVVENNKDAPEEPIPDREEPRVESNAENVENPTQCEENVYPTQDKENPTQGEGNPSENVETNTEEANVENCEQPPIIIENRVVKQEKPSDESDDNECIIINLDEDDDIE